MSFAQTTALLVSFITAPPAAGLKVHEEASADACACIPWAEAYAKHGAQCGATGREIQGIGSGVDMANEPFRSFMLDTHANWEGTDAADGTREYKQVPRQAGQFQGQYEGLQGLMNWELGKKTGPKKSMTPWFPLAKKQKSVYDAFCTDFFMKIKDNFCVNWWFNANADEGRQWCYVSPSCSALGKGGHYAGTVAVKGCDEFDRKTYMMDPPELGDVARNNGIDLAILSKFSYPMFKGWFDLGKYEIQDIRNSPRPTLWDSRDGFPPLIVYSKHGGSKYRVDYLPGASGEVTQAERRASNTAMVCVSFC